MGVRTIIFIIGVALAILQYKKIVYTPLWMIICCFLVWAFLNFISIHNKNKERMTPRPVYVINK